MSDKERLFQILSVPIYPHEQVDPLEAVADYLIDNDVIPVVRCKDCSSWKKSSMDCGWCEAWEGMRYHNHFCNYGERRSNG
jgi:hypothetical protein